MGVFSGVRVYPLRKLAHAIYRDFSEEKNENFNGKKIVWFNIFAQNIHRGYTLAPLTSTHNVCFGSKIRKIVIPLQTPIFSI